MRKGTPSSLLGLVAAHRQSGKMQALAEGSSSSSTRCCRARTRRTTTDESTTRATRPFRQARSHDDEVFYLKLRGDALLAG